MFASPWRPRPIRPLSTLRLVVLLAAGCGEDLVFDRDEPWPPQSDWPGIGAGKVMVTNSGDDTLSFLDPDTLEPLYVAATGRVPAEREGPHHGAATPDGAFYFVGISNVVPSGGSGPHGSHGTGTVDGYLLRYDCEDNAPAGELRVDRSPGDVRTTADGRFVLQSHFDLVSIAEAAERGDDPRELRSALIVTDATTMERVASIPVCPAGHGIAPSADGSEVYVTCWGSDELAIVPLGDSPTDDVEVVRVPIGPDGGNPQDPLFGPYAAAVSPDGTEVWVSNVEGTSVAVYDVASGAFDQDRFIDFTFGAPFFAAFSATGDRLYVPVQNPDSLVTIERATGDVLFTLNFTGEQCRLPHGTLVLAGGDKLGLVCEGDRVGPGTVVRIDLTPADGPAIEEVFEVGVYPDDLIAIAGAP